MDGYSITYFVLYKEFFVFMELRFIQTLHIDCIFFGALY